MPSFLQPPNAKNIEKLDGKPFLATWHAVTNLHRILHSFTEAKKMDNTLISDGIRHVKLKIEYESKDVSLDLVPYLISVDYEDVTMPDSMDSLSMTFQDKDGLFRGPWFPGLGAKYWCEIHVHNWYKPGDHFVREAGQFEIDDLTASSGAGGNTFTISAVPIGVTDSIRRQENTRAWENASVSSIAGSIAAEHGFKLNYMTGYDPVIDRLDQRQQSDLGFLKQMCAYCGLMLKIASTKANPKQINIWSAEEFDQQPPAMTIKRGMEGVGDCEFRASANDVYSSVSVKFLDPKTNELVDCIYTPESIRGSRPITKKDGGTKGRTQLELERLQGKSGGASSKGSGAKIDPVTLMPIQTASSGSAKQTKQVEDKLNDPEIGKQLKINQRVGSLAEAEMVAKAALRSANMRYIQATVNFMGNPKIFSGATVLVEGWGIFDTAIWYVEKVHHSYSKSGGYRTTADLRGVLNGY